MPHPLREQEAAPVGMCSCLRLDRDRPPSRGSKWRPREAAAWPERAWQGGKPAGRRHGKRAPTATQRDRQHLGSAGTQVRSPARHHGLRIQCCRSCGLVRGCGSGVIAGLGAPCATGQPKKKKKKKGDTGSFRTGRIPAPWGAPRGLHPTALHRGTSVWGCRWPLSRRGGSVNHCLPGFAHS